MDSTIFLGIEKGGNGHEAVLVIYNLGGSFGSEAAAHCRFLGVCLGEAFLVRIEVFPGTESD